MDQVGRGGHDEGHTVPLVVPETGCVFALRCLLESEAGLWARLCLLPVVKATWGSVLNTANKAADARGRDLVDRVPAFVSGQWFL